MSLKRFEHFLKQALPKLEDTKHVQHPSQEALVAYVYEHLDRETIPRISAHITTCQACYEKVRQLRSELEILDGQMAAFLPDPLQAQAEKSVKKERERQLLQQLPSSLREIWSGVFAERRVVYAHLAAYAGAVALLVGINALLNRLLVPPASPLASPTKIIRWWSYSYWLLLPLGLLLVAHLVSVFLSKKRKERRDHEKG